MTGRGAITQEVRLTLGMAELPTWLRVLPLGQVTLVDGRPPFQVDPESLAQIVKAFEARGTDLVIDYEHQSLKGEKAPAAGWIKDLEVREDGLWALVEWTEPAAEYLRRREYRYFSPVLRLDPESRRPLELVNVALTNTPAIQGLAPLVARWGGEGTAAKTGLEAAATKEGTQERQALLSELRVRLGLGREVPEDEVLRQVVGAFREWAEKLGLPAEAPLTQWAGVLETLRAEEQQALRLREELASLQARLAEEQARRTVEEAILAGKISPAQREWALCYCRRDPEGFKSYVEQAPQVVPVGHRLKLAGEKGGECKGLSPEELALCRALNLAPESYLEAKASLGQVTKGGGETRCQL